MSPYHKVLYVIKIVTASSIDQLSGIGIRRSSIASIDVAKPALKLEPITRSPVSVRRPAKASKIASSRLKSMPNSERITSVPARERRRRVRRRVGNNELRPVLHPTPSPSGRYLFSLLASFLVPVGS